MRLQITTPPNTPKNNPLVTIVTYPLGEMKTQVIEIPKGHAYLTGIQIFAGHQGRIIPELESNVEWIVGDGRPIEKHVYIKHDIPSFELVINTYNEDDTYPHSHYIDLE